MRLLVTALLVCLHWNAVADPIATGMQAPEFALPASDGKTYSLSQFRGKKAVVIAFFPKVFTGG